MASRPFSIHCPGVTSTEDNRGYAYGNATLDGGHAVPPGATHTYHWYIPIYYSPSVLEGTCVTSAYYSTVDPEKDLNSGLIGPVVICRTK